MINILNINVETSFFKNKISIILFPGSIATICFMFIVVFILMLAGLYTYKIR